MESSVTVPMLTPGATDSCFFRQKGINTYGLFPAIITPEDLAGFHGIDERISLDNLRMGTRIIYDVLSEMCC
ncbi:MAG: M20/M25/M40 family metallo-hydrolase [Chloroflexi bacterium]|nr:M20/M25/M40 family metallo-hydrolase [Chloroflexota bacterium]